MPLQRIVFLGDLLDFEQGFIFSTRDRLTRIQNKILRTTRSEAVPLKQIYSLVGLLTSTEKIVSFGRIHFRALQAVLNSCLA